MKSTTPDPTGRFVLEGLKPYFYRLQYTHPDRAPLFTLEHTVAADQATSTPSPLIYRARRVPLTWGS